MNGIQRIEKSLGVMLFERTRRSIVLTAAGEQLAFKARQLLFETKEIEQIIASAHEPLSGPIHIGVIATLGPYLMPHVLPLLRKQYPKVQLVLHEGLTNELLTRLQTGMLDAIIAADPINASGTNTMELDCL